jgi:hypothetical protein
MEKTAVYLGFSLSARKDRRIKVRQLNISVSWLNHGDDIGKAELIES